MFEAEARQSESYVITSYRQNSVATENNVSFYKVLYFSCFMQVNAKQSIYKQCI